MAKSIFRQVMFFFVDYHLVWSSSQDYVIDLNLKATENILRIILHD